jgi:hypothetical protein
MNFSKTTGYILIGIGAAFLLGLAVWAFSYPFELGSTRVFVMLFGLIIAGPLIGMGVYTLNKGAVESADEKVIAKQRKLLNMVQTQGKVNLAMAAVDMNLTRDEVKQLVQDLVGKQLFSGYIDWDAQMLYSVEASKVKGGRCPKCGGELEVAGKGLVKCPYCGSEVFSN